MGSVKKSSFRFIVLIPALVLAGVVLALLALTWEKPALPRAAVLINGQRIEVEIAASPAELYHGLSGRSSLAADSGLLFVFADSAERVFVMRQMSFPLDIVFINQGRISKIAANLPPEGDRPRRLYTSAGPADQVLELNAGYAEQHGFQVGDRVSIGDNYDQIK
ncbi:MAG: DUF192 domain-containing protein [Patescibacteria group bacterium]